MSYTGSCHCGKISIELMAEVTSGLSCNCSICRRKGSILAFFPAKDVEIKAEESDLGTYLFGKKHIEHRFCKTCGTSPYSNGKAPDGSEIIAVNLRCLDDFDVNTVAITLYDGASL